MYSPLTTTSVVAFTARVPRQRRPADAAQLTHAAHMPCKSDICHFLGEQNEHVSILWCRELLEMGETHPFGKQSLRLSSFSSVWLNRVVHAYVTPLHQISKLVQNRVTGRSSYRAVRLSMGWDASDAF